MTRSQAVTGKSHLMAPPGLWSVAPQQNSAPTLCPGFVPVAGVKVVGVKGNPGSQPDPSPRKGYKGLGSPQGPCFPQQSP